MWKGLIWIDDPLDKEYNLSCGLPNKHYKPSKEGIKTTKIIDKKQKKTNIESRQEHRQQIDKEMKAKGFLNKKDSCELLKISDKTLYRYVKIYNLKVKYHCGRGYYMKNDVLKIKEIKENQNNKENNITSKAITLTIRDITPFTTEKAIKYLQEFFKISSLKQFYLSYHFDKTTTKKILAQLDSQGKDITINNMIKQREYNIHNAQLFKYHKVAENGNAST